MAIILLTGGTGYIGSHTAIELLEKSYEVVIVDNLVNSDKNVIHTIEEISGKKVRFFECDVTDKERIVGIFNEAKPDAVIHFAALKAVGESVAHPLRYYRNNLDGLITILEVMNKFSVSNIVFSSSATVYGDPASLPIQEDFALTTTNPYGWTKLMSEQIIKDVAYANSELNYGILRYFNPVGAHSSAKIGENPNGTPNNLMPYIVQTAAGLRDRLTIFGNDYETPDGTGVRDYIHVVDLAKGHVAAVEKMLRDKTSFTVNLGTGRGYSVLEIVQTFERVNNVNVPYQFGARRPGDIAACYADPTYAQELLGWSAELSLDDMVRDAWRWQKHITKKH